MGRIDRYILCLRRYRRRLSPDASQTQQPQDAELAKRLQYEAALQAAILVLVLLNTQFLAHVRQMYVFQLTRSVS